jgi:extracellular elastinolytic metalloproteinase
MQIGQYRPARRWMAAALATCTALGLAIAVVPGSASAAPARHATGDAHGKAGAQGLSGDRQSYDARSGDTPRARQALRAKAAAAAARPAAVALRQSLGTQAVLDMDGLTGTPRQVSRLDGFLTGPGRGRPVDIALRYIRTHLDAFGLTAADLATLHLRQDYVDIAGIHHLSFVQTLDGTNVFGNGIKAHVTRDGSLISVQGSPVAASAAPARASRNAVGSGAEAIRAARTDLAEKSAAPGRADSAAAVLFMTPTGLRRAWSTITMSAARPAQHVIDAQTGRVLYRRSLSDDAAPSGDRGHPRTPATGVAFPYFPGASRGGAQVPLNFTQRGWLPATAATLSGNNSHTYADVNDSNSSDATEEIPPRSGSSWNYPLRPFHLADVSFCDNPWPCSWDPDTPFSWQVNKNQNATQVFSFVNNWHDHLAAGPIGFTEAAGNFQLVNGSGRGAGGDPVNAETDDGANTADGLPDGGHIDNANMSTPPDGISPRMQMYLQHQPGTTYPDGDPWSPTNVGDEADTVYHEYTHGLSNRLVVDANGDSTLGPVQAGAMGEAWGDWYGMDYLVSRGLQRDTRADGDIVMFQYDGQGVFFDRTEPVDCAVGSTSQACPGTDGTGPGGYTYGDYGKVAGVPEVHSDGEIWAQTLWDLRTAVGSAVAESLVTRAMELSPGNPSFLDERNAILQADGAVFHGRFRTTIWRVFAHRGMGFFAGALDGNDAAPGEDFSLPPRPGAPTGTLTGVAKDSATGAPIPGVTVTVVFQGSAQAANPSAVTDAGGRYTLRGLVAGTYPKVVAAGAGFEGVTTSVTVKPGTTTRDFALRRDWAASSGGAQVSAFDGPDFSPDCGPDFAIDLSTVTGWGSTADLGADGQPTADTPKSITIALPKPVTISQFAVDPSATCGDGGSASTGDYTIETTTNGTTWVKSAGGTFTAADRGRLNLVAPAAGTGTAVTAIRFTMVTPQVFQVGECPGPFSGCDFMDLSEIEVYGS